MAELPIGMQDESSNRIQVYIDQYHGASLGLRRAWSFISSRSANAATPKTFERLRCRLRRSRRNLSWPILDGAAPAWRALSRVSAVGPHQAHGQPRAGRFGVAAQGGEGRRHPAALQPRDCGLGRAEPPGDLPPASASPPCGREPAPRPACTLRRLARMPPGTPGPP